MSTLPTPSDPIHAATSPARRAAAAGPLSRWLFGEVPERRGPLSLTLLSVLVYAMFAVVVSWQARMGLMDARDAARWSMIGLSGILGFYALIRSGLSWRLGSDPSLTFPQMAFSTGATVYGYAIDPQMRGAVIAIMVLNLVWGMFVLRGRQTLGRLSEELAKEPFVIERTFDAPDSLVWKAISEPDQIAEWFAELKGFRAEVGAEAEWDCDKDGMVYRHRHRVTEVVPGKRLAYSWRYEGHEGEALVTFELFPEGGKTRLKLTHAGLETFQPEKFPAFARKNFRKGWTTIIGTHLGEFLAKQAAAR